MSNTEWNNAFFIKASRFWEKGFDEQAFRWFLHGAKAGNTACMLNLGVMYGDRRPINKYKKQELFWYKKAWKKGELSAASNIAIAYIELKQLKKAEKWFTIAIRSGDRDANLELAKMYIKFSIKLRDIPRLLEETISSNHVTQGSVEEAQCLLSNKIWTHPYCWEIRKES